MCSCTGSILILKILPVSWLEAMVENLAVQLLRKLYKAEKNIKETKQNYRGKTVHES